jgi:nicotinate-nucleotide adenylyltransferase
VKKRVGLFGGTFDPIHYGHLMLAENAYDSLKLDEVLFVVSGKSYLKSNVSKAKDRLSMTSLAISDNPHFALSTVETDRGEDVDSYSYETILTLKSHNPDTDYYFMVGADSFTYMDQWKKPDVIFENTTVTVAFREGSSIEELKNKAKEYKEKYENVNIEFLPFMNIGISSTDIRNRVREGRTIRYLTPEAVSLYIDKNGLFRA